MLNFSYSKYELDITKYQFIKDIQHGAFGKVSLICEKEKKEKKYAAKVLNGEGKDKKIFKEMINREIGIMIYVNHPTIIHFEGYSITDINQITIIMQYAEKGSLGDILRKGSACESPKGYSVTSKQIILVGIARAMQYLHDRNITHRDLKPDNILLDEKFHPLVTDFGLSKIMEIGKSNIQSKQVGTIDYMAPEINSLIYDPKKADVYSFGIIMYEVVTNSKLDIISKPFIPIFENKGEFGSIEDLIVKCCSLNPSERPSFEEIFNKLSDITNNQFILNNVYINDLDLYIKDISETNDPTETVITKYNDLNNKLQKINNNITIGMFNLLDLDEQLNVLKNLPNNNIFLCNIFKFFHYIKDVYQLESHQYLQIITKENNNSILVIDKDYQIKLSYLATEIIFSDSFKIDDFYQHLSNNFLIQMKYPSKEFQKNFEQILKLPNQNGQIKMEILIDGNDIEELISNTENGLFEGNFLLSQITISSPIKRIGKKAFKNCTLLNYISLPFGIENLESDIFYQCSSLTQITIPSSVKIIGPYSFYKCQSIKSIDIPDSVQNIGEFAFSDCTSLEKIKIPNGIETIKDYTFFNCESLQSIEFPSSLTLIESYSFGNCSSICQITIPDNVTNIGSYSFGGCNKLTQIILPDKIKCIEEFTFIECESLKQITLPTFLVKIKQYAFSGCNNLKKIIFPCSLISIGSYAFSLCTQLNSAFFYVIPPLKTINEGLFSECNNLKSICIPNSVEEIEKQSFYKCSKLEEITIPSNITKIEDQAFDECISLASIKFLDASKVSSIGLKAF